MYKFPPLWKQACAGILLILVVLQVKFYQIAAHTALQRDISQSILNSYNAYGQAEMPVSIDARDLYDCRDMLFGFLFKKFDVKLANEPQAQHQTFIEWCSRGGQLQIVLSKKPIK
jgi:hypothetical protein